MGQGTSHVAQAERAALREAIQESLFGKSKSDVWFSFSIFNPELFLKVLQFRVVWLGEKSKKTKTPHRHR